MRTALKSASKRASMSWRTASGKGSPPLAGGLGDCCTGRVSGATAGPRTGLARCSVGGLTTLAGRAAAVAGRLTILRATCRASTSAASPGAETRRLWHWARIAEV
jgi:hypothetical protein